jgi:methionyl-tRNA synthetase
MGKDKIEFSEFLEIEKKLEIHFGKIIQAERVEKSKKLLKLVVQFKLDDSDNRTVITNIGSHFSPEQLIGVTCPFVTNLNSTTIMGIVSEAMIMVGQVKSPDGTVNFEIENYNIGTQIL